VEKQPIILIGDFNKSPNDKNFCNKTLELNLNILGEQVLFHINVREEMIKLSDIVPFARKLSTQISMFIIEKLRKQSITIPCDKGCSSCCSYLVPLSVPEAFYLRKEIISLPEEKRKTILNLCLANARKILQHKPVKCNLLNINELSDWYSSLELKCPFLSDDICSSYEQRPIACREYFVTGSAVLCNHDNNHQSSKFVIPVSILECLGRLSAEIEQTEIESIMLPLALPWAEENQERDMKRFPALELVEHLVEIIEESSKSSMNTEVSKHY
jgi:Fe-S-cluster containining protein